jgi:HYR domain
MRRLRRFAVVAAIGAACLGPGVSSASATSPAGAHVTYTATGGDTDGDHVDVACAPASGSTFPIGTTTVSCTATDAHGNSSAPATFTVTVVSAGAQLANEIVTVSALGPGASFASQLRAAQAAFASGDRAAGCAQLAAYVSHVKAQSGKSLTAAQAAVLLADEARIAAAFGC